MNVFISSMGKGKIIVEFFSAEMCVKVCKNLSCNAAGDSEITSEASFRDFEDFNSPSACMTFALASLVASASAAIALCRF